MPIFHLKRDGNEERFNICQPNNPVIPFFPSHTEYKQNRLPPPDPTHSRCWAWLVEPGVFSIEIYEAIIAQTLSRSSLQKYVCQAGVVQMGYARTPGVVCGKRDQRVREDRDVCFTLMSIEEQLAIIRWMEQYGVNMVPSPKVATPYGFLLLPMSAMDGATRREICKDLGFGCCESDYPRSRLLPGVISLSDVDLDFLEWALLREDGEPREGRATDDCGVQRVEWPSQSDA